MSKKYIEQEAVMNACKEAKMIGLPEWNCGIEYAQERIKDLPAADVVEVKPGYWEFEVDDRLTWCTRAICSSCKQTVELTRELTQDWGKKLFLKDNLFCAKCGAKMDEGQNE